MAMSMQELFYGPSEPVYLVHNYARHTPAYPSQTHWQALPDAGGRCTVPTFDMMVPMCCSRCEEKVQKALLQLEGVLAVVCDRYNQRVHVTGYVDPMKALKQVKRVGKKQASLWSRIFHKDEHEDEYMSPTRTHHHHHDRREYRSHSSQYTPSNCGEYSYSWDYCTAYRDSTPTHYFALPPNNVDHVEYLEY